MRRLPIFFLIDVSESMVGEPINEVSNGIKKMIAMLRQDPQAIETAYISIIVFAGQAKTVVPLTELINFYPPHLPIGGGTSLGIGLRHLMYEMDKNLIHNNGEKKGDWKPIIFLFTDGVPTDDAEQTIREWEKFRKTKSNMVAVSVGYNTDLSLLTRLTDNVVILNDLNSESYKYFFKWISVSISTQSQKLDSFGNDGFQIANLDESLAKKAELLPRSCQRFDENYVVLSAKCQKNAASYLIKYRLNTNIEWDELFTDDSSTQMWGKYVLCGAFPIVALDEYLQLSSDHAMINTINVMDLVGVPSCPCCGNPPGFGQCQCGGIHCIKGAGLNHCPHCGKVSYYGLGEDGFNLNRAQG